MGGGRGLRAPEASGAKRRRLKLRRWDALGQLHVEGEVLASQGVVGINRHALIIHVNHRGLHAASAHKRW